MSTPLSFNLVMKFHYLLLLFFLIGLCRANESEKFYFQTAYEEITSALTVEEILTKLALMNEESKVFLDNDNKTSLDTETRKEYVMAQERISLYLISRRNYFNFEENSEVSLFADYLIFSLEQNLELFTKSTVLDVLRLILNTTKKQPLVVNSMNIVLRNLIPKFNAAERRILYDIYMNDSPVSTSFFVHPMMAHSNYLDPQSVQAFINSYVARIFDFRPAKEFRNNLAGVLIMLHLIGNSDLVFQDITYANLLVAIKGTIHHCTDKLAVRMQETLTLTIAKVHDKPDLVRHVIDLLLNEHFTQFFDKETIQPAIKDLMMQCIAADRAYFKSVIDNTNLLDRYKSFSKQFSTVLLYLSNLKLITPTSTEAQFKLAIGSAKKLLQLQRANELDYPVFTVFFKGIKVRLDALRDLLGTHHSINSNQVPCLYLVAYLCILAFEVEAANTNNQVPLWVNCYISYYVGHLIFKAKELKEYPTELVNDVQPILNKVVKGFRGLENNINGSISALNMSAFLHFLKLHPTPEIINETTNKIALIMILSNHLSKRAYNYIAGFEFISELEITVTGFLLLLQKHLMNPKQEDVVYLKEYYLYLNRNNFLSKSEKLLFKSIMNDL